MEKIIDLPLDVKYTVIDCQAINQKFIKLVVDGIELLVVYKVSKHTMQMLDSNVGKGFPAYLLTSKNNQTLREKLIGYLKYLALI